MIKTIITLTTCHNRKSKTLCALERLHCQQVPPQYKIQHVVVDDGCTDGTPTEIAHRFPHVKIIRGDGNLFWAGGMRFGWDHYVKFQHFDYLLAYNDDVVFRQDAVHNLIRIADGNEEVPERSDAVVVGSFLDDQNELSYGGLIRSFKFLPLHFKIAAPSCHRLVHADTLNMNACLIPRSVSLQLGFLSPGFAHNAADIDFGLRANKLGVPIVVCPAILGICSRNLALDRFYLDMPSLYAAYKFLLSVKKSPFRERYLLCKRHGGWLWPVLFIVPYVLLPLRYFYARLLRWCRGAK